MYTNEYLEGLNMYVQSMQERAKDNPEKFKKECKEALQRTGIIDTEGNLLPPYNGTNVNETDFTRGPGREGSNAFVKRRNINE